MTKISINEMIVKVNSLPFYEKFVEAVRSMLLTFQDVLSSPKWSYSFIGEKNAMWSAPKQETVFYVQLGTAFDF